MKDSEIFEPQQHTQAPGPAPLSGEPPGGYLSTAQRVLLGQAAESLEHVSSAAELQDCADATLQGLLPHDQLLCGLGRLKDGRVADPWLLGHRLPVQRLEALVGPGQLLSWPLLQRWVADRRPLLLAEEPQAGWSQTAGPVGPEHPPLRNLALHGATDFSGFFISWFCFAGMPAAPGKSSALVLRVLVPHLHFALQRIRAGERKQRAAQRMVRLTERQLEVLHWVRLGKTNAEIGMILQTSEANVKYHLREIFRKLNVTNRAHAVTQLAAHDSARDRPYGGKGPSTLPGSVWSTG